MQGQGLGSRQDLVGWGLDLGVGLFDRGRWWEMKSSRCRCDQTNQGVRSIITAGEHHVFIFVSITVLSFTAVLFAFFSSLTHPSVSDADAHASALRAPLRWEHFSSVIKASVGGQTAMSTMSALSALSTCTGTGWRALERPCSHLFLKYYFSMRGGATYLKTSLPDYDDDDICSLLDV